METTPPIPRSLFFPHLLQPVKEDLLKHLELVLVDHAFVHEIPELLDHLRVYESDLLRLEGMRGPEPATGEIEQGRVPPPC